MGEIEESSQSISLSSCTPIELSNNEREDHTRITSRRGLCVINPSIGRLILRRLVLQIGRAYHRHRSKLEITMVWRVQSKTRMQLSILFEDL
ncbi:unnamed protein product [Thlaspi arvense]|uniref:Uncharacterized protein n=1 Tax=Thlaspi arvense TaxID=13288 RepID=A0AAU9T934_THLAR|nr:unnamed protein product [Thlaspi arvense]